MVGMGGMVGMGARVYVRLVSVCVCVCVSLSLSLSLSLLTLSRVSLYLSLYTSLASLVRTPRSEGRVED